MPPTSHVVEVTNALRPDEPRPSWPREEMLAAAPAATDDGLRGPEPAGMSADADRPHRRAGRRAHPAPATSRSAELFEAYRSRAAADELNAFTWVAEETPAAAGADAPLAGVPVAVKDLFCTEGIPSQSGSKILEGYRPPYTATVVRKLQEAGAPILGKTNQDEFAMGSSNENSAYGPVANPWDRSRVPGRVVAAAAPPRSPPASRRGRSAPTPAARSASPPRCAGSSASSPPTARARATG